MGSNTAIFKCATRLQGETCELLRDLKSLVEGWLVLLLLFSCVSFLIFCYYEFPENEVTSYCESDRIF